MVPDLPCATLGAEGASRTVAARMAALNSVKLILLDIVGLFDLANDILADLLTTSSVPLRKFLLRRSGNAIEGGLHTAYNYIS